MSAWIPGSHIFPWTTPVPAGHLEAKIPLQLLIMAIVNHVAPRVLPVALGPSGSLIP